MAIIQYGSAINWKCDDVKFEDFIKARDYKKIRNKKKRTIYISPYHASIFNSILEEGIIVAEYGNLALIFIEVGALALSNNYLIRSDILTSIKNHFNKERDSWKIRKLIESEIELLKKVMRVSENQEVADLLDYNSGNIEIANIYRTLFRRDPSNTKTKEHISVSIIEKCKLLLKNELSTDDFEIERGCGNERLDLRIPEEFICLMKEIRKQTFKDKDTSRIIRISLITGMYLFCNIIISGSVELLDIEIGRVLDGLMKLHIKYSSKNTYD